MKLALVLIVLPHVGYLAYREIDIDKKYLYFCYGGSILISFLGGYIVNPLFVPKNAINLFSVTETIYNVADFTPYLWVLCPILCGTFKNIRGECNICSPMYSIICCT